MSADRGYDALQNYRGIVEDFGAVPIIPMRAMRADAKKRRPGSEYRTECAIPRDSKEWKRLYAMRTGIERLFGRAKETRRLERHCYRGIEKVELHCLLSVLTLQAKAVVQLEADESLRQCLRKVA
ncbi:MAG: transposase [Chloroflexi bacterium]|nr:transposase [Chloroflexota bacterium]